MVLKIARHAAWLVVAVVAAGCSDGEPVPLCANCPDGCCDVRGVCRAGNTPDNCGLGGASCALCQDGQVCESGRCVANCASTCEGCCDGQGQCHPTSNQTCGVGGLACVVCEPSTSCQRGLCERALPTCGPRTCGGCCRGNDCVEPGNTPQACGSGGRACARCAEQRDCVAGRCLVDSCGRCKDEGECCYEGKCFPGDTFGLCGKPGESCVSCEVGQVCEDRRCKSVPCDAAQCPEGCCKDGKCHLPGPSDAAACGKGGVACVACGSGELCREGACEEPPPLTCDPLECAGCCADGKCVAGDSGEACGEGGACVSCASSQQCVGHACTCTATSCAGCCDGDACRMGLDNDDCGKGGVACSQCTGDQSCTEGACVEVCDATTCATGCCEGTTCHHSGGADPKKCGVGGAACAPCDELGGEQCVDGVCVNPVACGLGGADPCGTGCCAGPTCLKGTEDMACGDGGGSCQLCPSWASCEVLLFGRGCTASDVSLWGVTLTRVELDDSIAWDSSSSPDVFVVVTIGGKSVTSSTAKDSFAPVFNEYLMAATGKDLKLEITYVIYDDDIWPLPNNKILECTDRIFAHEFAAGFAEIAFPCGNASSNPVKLIRFELAPLTTV